MTIKTLTVTETEQVSGAFLRHLSGLTSLIAVPALPALPAVPTLPGIGDLAGMASFNMAMSGSLMGAGFGGSAGTNGGALVITFPGVDALLGLIPTL